MREAVTSSNEQPGYDPDFDLRANLLVHLNINISVWIYVCRHTKIVQNTMKLRVPASTHQEVWPGFITGNESGHLRVNSVSEGIKYREVSRDFLRERGAGLDLGTVEEAASENTVISCLSW